MQTGIIIIGGGITGLMAAKDLSSRGKKIILLEAGNRLGGRVSTVIAPGFDTVLETGAEFIHGNLPLTLSLLKEAGISFYKIEGKRMLNENGQWNTTDDPLEGWSRLIKKMNTLEKDITLHEFLEKYFPEEKDTLLKKNVRHYAEGFDLADINTASTMALRDEWMNEEEDTYRIDGGYQQLVEYLYGGCKENGVEFHLSSAVKSIEWNKGAATIHTDGGDVFSAGKVIVTVPVKMLQQKNNAAGSIDFVPPVPEYTDAAEKIGYGTVIKIFLQFSDAFWLKHNKDTGFIISNQVIPTWWTQLPQKSKMLTGWLGGPAAKALRNANEEIILKLALESVANIFSLDPDLLQSILRAYKVSDWSQVPFINGGYSYATVDTENARKVLQAPIDETIYFAGEGIYKSDSPGTVEAALFAGISVAEGILKSQLVSAAG